MLRRKSRSEDKRALVAFAAADKAKELSAHFDLTFGKNQWIAASHEDALDGLSQLSTEDSRYLVVSVQTSEGEVVERAARLVREAKAEGCQVILLAEALDPASMHTIMRAGTDDFLPLPVSATALQETVDRLAAPAATAAAPTTRRGEVHVVYGVAGGVGATTLAVNLAWETAVELEKTDRKVVLLDFNFLFGSVATYLDLPRREAIYELLSDPDSMDREAFEQALTTPEGGKLRALTAPTDALPLDIVEPGDVDRLLDVARSNYDFVFIDMPQSLTHWFDRILKEADGFYALMESDMRSAQNMLRFIRALQAEELPAEKVVACLSRAPSFTDLSGKSRIKRLEESLNITFAYRLPDGGKQVREACDQGAPLGRVAKGNALRKEIRQMAKELLEAAEAAKKTRLM